MTLGCASVLELKQTRYPMCLYQLGRAFTRRWSCSYAQGYRTSTHSGQLRLFRRWCLAWEIAVRSRSGGEQIWYWWKGIRYKISQLRERFGRYGSAVLR